MVGARRGLTAASVPAARFLAAALLRPLASLLLTFLLLRVVGAGLLRGEDSAGERASARSVDERGEGAERALELVLVRGGVADLAWAGAAELAGGRGGDGGDQEEDGAAIHRG